MRESSVQRRGCLWGVVCKGCSGGVVCPGGCVWGDDVSMGLEQPTSRRQSFLEPDRNNRHLFIVVSKMDTFKFTFTDIHHINNWV